MELQKREHLIELYDIYGQLLTDKQRSYFEDYYYLDLSISEIAENNSISRNGVFDQLKRVQNILIDYEEKLHLLEKMNKISNLSEDKFTKDEVINIIKE